MSRFRWTTSHGWGSSAPGSEPLGPQTFRGELPDLPRFPLPLSDPFLTGQSGPSHVSGGSSGAPRTISTPAMKYSPERERVISGIKRVSKPGLRVYSKTNEIPRVLGGLGVAVLSTSNGLVTDREARKARVGGEVLCYVW